MTKAPFIAMTAATAALGTALVPLSLQLRAEQAQGSLERQSSSLAPTTAVCRV